MSMEAYEAANKQAQKAFRAALNKGEYPYLSALDDFLPYERTAGEKYIGLIEIPLNLVAGTKTAGRQNSFASNFMPLLSQETEFAFKWADLYEAQLDEGIRDPIVAYEYMHRFYIMEGNKRVSVLKSLKAVKISAKVTRIIPKKTEELENKIYYEFMEFYELSKVNYVWFSEEGSFVELQKEVGKDPDEVWSDDDKLTFSSIYTRFLTEFKANGGDELNCTPGDAFLAFIKVHDYEDLEEMTTSELKGLVKKSWEEFELLQEEEEIDLKMDPTFKEKTIFDKLLPASVTKLKAAFIYEKSPMTSAWTYAHELGRLQLEQRFPKEVTTVCYENVTVDTVEDVLEEAVEEGCNLIFTTTPAFAQASVKAAIAHPKIRILNCSLNTSHRYIRTYYSRMHEAKFLMGAIAGAMARNDKLAYIADYPIFGTIANINAFALGAKMINPRATVYLDWSAKKDNDALWNFKNSDASIISGKDMVIPEDASRYFGIFEMNDGYPKSLAMPVWQWGNFYEKLIRTIMEGTWKYDDDPSTTKAINYWWGMSADVVGVICSQNLPIGTKRLVELLKNTISRGEFNPFSGILYSQEGIVQAHPYRTLSPEAIMEMDWLAENVIGSIPKETELKEHTKAVVGQQGLDKAKG